MTQEIKNLKVLIVDDNQQMLELLKTVLESFGILNIFSASGGHEGFRSFSSKSIDVVITDLVMPKGDGIELIRNIRNNQKSPNQYVPVILITGNPEKAKVINARDAGITDIILKPFNARDLYKRIERMVENPKKFVRSENFFGPDRRHKKHIEPYKGPYRRKTDPKKLRDQSEDDASILHTKPENKVSQAMIDLI